jgi:hypothetical protein
VCVNFESEILMSSKIHRGRRSAGAIARALCCALVAIAFTGCMSMYVDNSLQEVPPSAYQRPNNPEPVQLLFSFQTNGVANAKGTETLIQEATSAVTASGLFAGVSRDPVPGGALMSITINNVPITSQGSAMTKGVVTGATLGLAGSEVSDGYVCTIEFVRSFDAPKVTSSVQHAIHSTIGVKGAPANGTKAANPETAVKTVTRQAIANALKALALDPAFQS